MMKQMHIILAILFLTAIATSTVSLSTVEGNIEPVFETLATEYINKIETMEDPKENDLEIISENERSRYTLLWPMKEKIMDFLRIEDKRFRERYIQIGLEKFGNKRSSRYNHYWEIIFLVSSGMTQNENLMTFLKRHDIPLQSKMYFLKRVINMIQGGCENSSWIDKVWAYQSIEEILKSNDWIVTYEDWKSSPPPPEHAGCYAVTAHFIAARLASIIFQNDINLKDSAISSAYAKINGPEREDAVKRLRERLPEYRQWALRFETAREVLLRGEPSSQEEKMMVYNWYKKYVVYDFSSLSDMAVFAMREIVRENCDKNFIATIFKDVQSAYDNNTYWVQGRVLFFPPKIPHLEPGASWWKNLTGKEPAPKGLLPKSPEDLTQESVRAWFLQSLKVIFEISERGENFRDNGGIQYSIAKKFLSEYNPVTTKSSTSPAIR